MNERRGQKPIQKRKASVEQLLLVIRSSGIWNSRSPFNDYLSVIRRIGRVTSLLGGGAYELRRLGGLEPNKDRTVSKAFAATFNSSKEASLYGELYRDQYPALASPRPPLVKDLLNDIRGSLNFLQERALLARYGAFEQFIHCWYLNIILAKLENSDKISEAENRIATQIGPFSRGRPPDVKTVLETLPEIWNQLRVYPRLKVDRFRPAAASDTADPRFGALASIIFWRDYRNLHVHAGGFVTYEFYRKHSAYYAEALGPHVGKELERTAPLPVSVRLTGAMATAMYRVAALLTAHLETISGGRRGHPEAPSAKTIDYWPSAPRSNPLLCPGDHGPSLRWLEDEQFRLRLSQERGWSLTPVDAAYTPAVLKEREA